MIAIEGIVFGWQDILEALTVYDVATKLYVTSINNCIPPATVTDVVEVIPFGSGLFNIVDYITILTNAFSLTASFIENEYIRSQNFASPDIWHGIGFMLDPVDRAIELRWTGNALSDSVFISCYYEIEQIYEKELKELAMSIGREL